MDNAEDSALRSVDRSRSRSNSSLTSNANCDKAAAHTEAEQELLLAKMQIVALKGQLESAVAAKEIRITAQLPIIIPSTTNTPRSHSEGKYWQAKEDSWGSRGSASDTASGSSSSTRCASILGSGYDNSKNNNDSDGNYRYNNNDDDSSDDDNDNEGENHADENKKEHENKSESENIHGKRGSNGRRGGNVISGPSASDSSRHASILGSGYDNNSSSSNNNSSNINKNRNNNNNSNADNSNRKSGSSNNNIDGDSNSHSNRYSENNSSKKSTIGNKYGGNGLNNDNNNSNNSSNNSTHDGGNGSNNSDSNSSNSKNENNNIRNSNYHHGGSNGENDNDIHRENESHENESESENENIHGGRGSCGRRGGNVISGPSASDSSRQASILGSGYDNNNSSSNNKNQNKNRNSNDTNNNRKSSRSKNGDSTGESKRNGFNNSSYDGTHKNNYNSSADGNSSHDDNDDNEADNIDMQSRRGAGGGKRHASMVLSKAGDNKYKATSGTKARIGNNMDSTREAGISVPPSRAFRGGYDSRVKGPVQGRVTESTGDNKDNRSDKAELIDGVKYRRESVVGGSRLAFSELLQEEQDKVKHLQALCDAQTRILETDSYSGDRSRGEIGDTHSRRASLLSSGSGSLVAEGSGILSLRASYEAKLSAQEIEIRRQEAYVAVQDQKCREIEGLLKDKEIKMKKREEEANRSASSERKLEKTIQLHRSREADLLEDLEQQEQRWIALESCHRKQQDAFHVERIELGDQITQMVGEISALRVNASLRAKEHMEAQQAHQRERKEDSELLQKREEELTDSYERRLEAANASYHQHHIEVNTRNLLE